MAPFASNLTICRHALLINNKFCPVISILSSDCKAIPVIDPLTPISGKEVSKLPSEFSLAILFLVAPQTVVKSPVINILPFD